MPPASAAHSAAPSPGASAGAPSATAGTAFFVFGKKLLSKFVALCMFGSYVFVVCYVYVLLLLCCCFVASPRQGPGRHGRGKGG